MAYKHFDGAKPDETQGNGTTFAQEIRDNEWALFDVLVGGVPPPGWSMTPSGGTPEQPAQLLFTSGAERLRLTLTWGTAGGAAGNPEQIVGERSYDSGATYVPWATWSLTYDANGNVINVTGVQN